MAQLAGSQTEANLMSAFAGESMARNRYTLFAKRAKKEGLVQISAIFAETAEHERVHAKRFFGLMEGGEVTITASYPAGPVGTTAQNLAAAVAGEQHENSTLYPGFAKVAREEGFKEAAAAFSTIARAEATHAQRFGALLANLEGHRVLTRDEPVSWFCRKCGYVHDGVASPGVCPACLHPASYFEVYHASW